jgi:hypothetical protein
MKKTLRKIHINEDLWKYSIKGDGGGGVSSIIIFSPKGSTHPINARDFFKFIYKWTEEQCRNWSYGDHNSFHVTPSEVKKYIIENLITES